MGLSASQGRLLTLTSRMSDLERRSQSISNQKMRLANSQSAVSQKYQNALNMEKITFYDGYKTVQATAQNLTEYNPNLTTQRFLKTADGKIAVSKSISTSFENSSSFDDFLAKFNLTQTAGGEGNLKYDKGKIDYYKNVYDEMYKNDRANYATIEQSQINSTQWLYENLSSGNMYLEGKDLESTDSEIRRINYKSDDLAINVESDSSYIAKAEAEYDAAMNDIKNKEKILDMELEKNSTEYSAVQQEIESVNKVMDKNISRTFKLFA